MPTSRIDIDLGAIERNLAAVRAVVSAESSPAPRSDRPADADPAAAGASRQRVSICAVLKQDAYGAGAARIARRLTSVATGVDSFAVYTLDEARVLAETVPNVPILVLMPTFGIERTDTLYRHAALGRLHLTLHNADQCSALIDAGARLGSPIPVHVQCDTGLSRGGSLAEKARALVERVVGSTRLRLAGLMTHFASPCSDDQFTREQAKSFRDFVHSVAPAIKSAAAMPTRSGQIALHAANSCAAFRSRSYHGTMVRVGQALLGYGADDAQDAGSFEFAKAFAALAPSIRWTTGVVHVEEIPAGWPVGYGSTWRAPHRSDGRPTRIALLPVGYADGYPRALGGRPGGAYGGWIGFTGRAYGRTETDALDRTASLATVYAPVVGRVSMDQITVDVTDVPESYLRMSRGNAGGAAPEMILPEAELYSRSRAAPNFLPAMAAAAGSITHELLCRIGPRVERVYAAARRAETEPAVRPVAASVA